MAKTKLVASSSSRASVASNQSLRGQEAASMANDKLLKSSSSSSSSSFRFKGVRKRSWGKWVSEIRIPHSRERIWLGSFATPAQAARAYDAASICLRGPSASLNFPSSQNCLMGRPPFSKQDVQSIAAAAASDFPPPADFFVDVKQEEDCSYHELPASEEPLYEFSEIFDGLNAFAELPPLVPLPNATLPIGEQTHFLIS